MAAEIPTKPVLDILATGENVPSIFTRELESNNSTDSSVLPWLDCPIIDFSLLSTSPDELKNLNSALVTWGLFSGRFHSHKVVFSFTPSIPNSLPQMPNLLINHGIMDSMLNEVREVSKEFFALPMEERTKYLRASNDPQGYGNDTVLSQNVPHNWNDRLYLHVYPEDQRKITLWPQTPPNFREVLHEFTMKVKAVNHSLVQIMARCLGLEDDSFVEEYGGDEMIIAARINFYPKCPFPKLVHASRAHSDASSMTILLQDEQVEGLQFLKDDKWLKVPIIPSALFVNVGDQMEIMSNGAFKSAVHRVVANSEDQRLSVAMFCSPNPEKEIGPLKKLVNEDQPPLYSTIKRYGEIFFRHHPKGKRPITATKI